MNVNILEIRINGPYYIPLYRLVQNNDPPYSINQFFSLLTWKKIQTAVLGRNSNLNVPMSPPLWITLDAFPSVLLYATHLCPMQRSIPTCISDIYGSHPLKQLSSRLPDSATVPKSGGTEIFFPIPSMYGIFIYIWLIFMVN